MSEQTLKTVPPTALAKWETYFKHIDNGATTELAAARASLSPAAAYRERRGEPTCQGTAAAKILKREPVEHAPIDMPSRASQTTSVGINKQALSPDAASSLKDFGKFRERYFGRKSLPWQTQAAQQVADLIETQRREYVVMNAPSGAGKSTLFAHDLPCWLIARNRRLRILIGSRTERQARLQVSRIKRSLERETPLQADPELVERGLAWNAIATLQDEYGTFRPEDRSELWRAEALTVQQIGGQAVDDKESSFAAYGADSGYLGGRYDLLIWDDLVGKRNSHTPEARAGLSELYFSEIESRLEPGGLLLLEGQRIQVDDLYRTALNQTRHDESKKYRHIVYKAHDESRCRSHHSTTAPSWPSGCLLDPRRLPFFELETTRKNNPKTFSLMFQQDDEVTDGSLIERRWIEGGLDSRNELVPGCLDRSRRLRQPPPDGEKMWSFICVDPSPANYWGILWYLYDDTNKIWWLMDIARLRLRPDDFIEYNIDTKQFRGLMPRWLDKSIELGVPVTSIVVEINAAQKWLLSQPHIQRWQQNTGVSFIPHVTHRNKLDTTYGVETIAGNFRKGKIRLPWADAGSRVEVKPFLDELYKYPEGVTDDLVMAHWFSQISVYTHFNSVARGSQRRVVPQGMFLNARRGIW